VSWGVWPEVEEAASSRPDEHKIAALFRSMNEYDGCMCDPGSTSGVWREAATIVGRYPSAAIIPGAVLGAIAEVPHYFVGEHPLLDNALTYVTAALAYYLYLAYAEEIVVEYEDGIERITLRGMLRELRDAIPYVPRVLAAGLVTLAMTGVATGLLVIPGVWLYTRWSLSTPTIRHENLGSAAALKRSNSLVRSRFWFILATATLAFILEEALIHMGSVGGYLVSGSHTWGEWIGGSTVAALVIPLAAFTTSVAYKRVAQSS
jgi:hypothetical protein